MASKKRERMQLIPRGDVMVVELGEMEIWDGADLALLRETLTRLMDVDQHKAVGIDMSHVKYIPSGFFGMLCDWHDRGYRMCLFSPQPNVARMLWFRRFFEHSGDDCFSLTYAIHNGEQPVEVVEYANDDRWEPKDDDEDVIPLRATPEPEVTATFVYDEAYEQ
jgi:anti-anti-sigma regulatory factor